MAKAKKKAKAKKATTKKTKKKTAAKKKTTKKTKASSKKAISKKASTKKAATKKKATKKKTKKKKSSGPKLSEEQQAEVKEKFQEQVKKQKSDSHTIGELSRQQIRSIEKMLQVGVEWQDLQSILEGAAKPYNMQANFVEKSAILHPTLGYGYVISADDNKMKVCFQEGIKNLVMNYKKA